MQTWLCKLCYTTSAMQYLYTSLAMQTGLRIGGYANKPMQSMPCSMVFFIIPRNLCNAAYSISYRTLGMQSGTSKLSYEISAMQPWLCNICNATGAAQPGAVQVGLRNLGYGIGATQPSKLKWGMESGLHGLDYTTWAAQNRQCNLANAFLETQPALQNLGYTTSTMLAGVHNLDYAIQALPHGMKNLPCAT